MGNSATLSVNVGGPSDLTAAQVNTLITGISGAASGGLQTGSTLALNTANPVLPEDVNAALRAFAEKYPGLVEFDPLTGMVRFKSDLTFAACRLLGLPS